MDYTSGPYSVTFPAGMMSVPLSIPINHNNIFEGVEYFLLTINSSLPTGVVSGYPDRVNVGIVDCKL